MTSKDPNLTRTPIAKDEDKVEVIDTVDAKKPITNDNDTVDNDTVVKKDSVVEDKKEIVLDDSSVSEGNLVREPKKNDTDIDNDTSVNKGTETLDNDVYDSKHVKEGDNPARQPDRRDQEGQTPFDGGVNADNTNLSDIPKSDEIDERERYASVDNAQTRVLAPDDKRPAQ